MILMAPGTRLILGISGLAPGQMVYVGINAVPQLEHRLSLVLTLLLLVMRCAASMVSTLLKLTGPELV